MKKENVNIVKKDNTAEMIGATYLVTMLTFFKKYDELIYMRNAIEYIANNIDQLKDQLNTIDLREKLTELMAMMDRTISEFENIKTLLSKLELILPIYDATILSKVIGEKTVEFWTVIRGGKPPYSYTWDFGDGTTSTEPRPVHTYASEGTYIVKLTVTDSMNNSIETTDVITVPIRGVEIRYLEKWITRGETYAIASDSLEPNAIIPQPMLEIPEQSATRSKELGASGTAPSDTLDTNIQVQTTDIALDSTVTTRDAEYTPQQETADAVEASITITFQSEATDSASASTRKTP